jgi:hypothetical protein
VDGFTEQKQQRLAAMPISEAEALEFAKTKWKDPAFRNQKLNEWNAFARAKYQSGIKPSWMHSEWLSLIALLLIAFGLVVYSRSRKG